MLGISQVQYSALPVGASTEATLAAVSGKLPATLGTKTMANSLAITIASDQSTLPVSLASVPSHPVTNAGTFAVQADTELPAAAALSDTTANPTTPMVGAGHMGWNGATWERVTTSGDSADAVATSGFGHLATLSHLSSFNGTTWDRVRGSIANGLLIDVSRVQGTVAVTGPLTDGQLRASAVPVSLTSTTLTGTSAISAASLPLPTGAATETTALKNPTAAILHVTAISGANATVTATLPAPGAGLFHYITAITITRVSTAAIAGTAILTYTSTNLPGTPAWTAGNLCAAGSTNTDLNYSPATPLRSAAANIATTIVAPAVGATGVARINVSYYTGS